jgi:hypothetical protein
MYITNIFSDYFAYSVKMFILLKQEADLNFILINADRRRTNPA